MYNLLFTEGTMREGMPFTLRQAKLMCLAAALHDVLKYLGGKKDQVMPDHEVMGAALFERFFEGKTYRFGENDLITLTQEDIQFLAGVVGNHENIHKEEGRSEWIRSEDLIERGRALFFVADVLTGVFKPVEGTPTFVIDHQLLKDRFEDLYFRHIHTTGKVFSPQWGPAALTDLLTTLEHLQKSPSFAIDTQNGPSLKDILCSSALRAIDRATPPLGGEQEVASARQAIEAIRAVHQESVPPHLPTVGEKLVRDTSSIAQSITLLPMQRYDVESVLAYMKTNGIKDLILLDQKVEGIEQRGVRQNYGYLLQQEGLQLTVIDHHVDDKEFSALSTGNLVRRFLEERSRGDAPVGITHTDCDSVISALMMTGNLPSLAEFGDAVLAADHTAAKDRFADLLQAIESVPKLAQVVQRGQLERSINALGLMLQEKGLPKDDREAFAARLQARDAWDKRLTKFQKLDAGVYAYTLPGVPSSDPCPEFLRDKLPDAKIILVYHRDPNDNKFLQIRAIKGKAAPQDLDITEVIKPHVPGYGGRPNAGSNRREGESLDPNNLDSITAQINERLRYRTYELPPHCTPSSPHITFAHGDVTTAQFVEGGEKGQEVLVRPHHLPTMVLWDPRSGRDNRQWVKGADAIPLPDVEKETHALVLVNSGGAYFLAKVDISKIKEAEYVANMGPRMAGTTFGHGQVRISFDEPIEYFPIERVPADKRGSDGGQVYKVVGQEGRPMTGEEMEKNALHQHSLYASYMGYPSKRRGGIDYVGGILDPKIHAGALVFQSVNDVDNLHREHAVRHEASLLEVELKRDESKLRREWGIFGEKRRDRIRQAKNLGQTKSAPELSKLVQEAYERDLTDLRNRYHLRAEEAVANKLKDWTERRKPNDAGDHPYVKTARLSFDRKQLHAGFGGILDIAHGGLGRYHPLTDNCALGLSRALHAALPKPRTIGEGVQRLLHNVAAVPNFNPLKVFESLKRRGVVRTVSRSGTDRATAVYGSEYVSAENQVVKVSSLSDIPLQWGPLELLKKTAEVSFREPKKDGEDIEFGSGSTRAMFGKHYILQVDGKDQQPIGIDLFKRTYREIRPNVFVKDAFTRVIHVPKGITAVVRSPVSEDSQEVTYPYALGIDADGNCYPFPYVDATSGPNPDFRVAGRVANLAPGVALFGDEGLVVRQLDDEIQVDCRLTAPNVYFGSDNEIRLRFAIKRNGPDGAWKVSQPPRVCDAEGRALTSSDIAASLETAVSLTRSDSQERFALAGVKPDAEGGANIQLSIFGNDILAFNLNALTQRAVVTRRDELDLFDVRQLAKCGGNFSKLYNHVAREKVNFTKQTDLHTHFGGEVSAHDLIEIALKNNNTYPSSLLLKAGVDRTLVDKLTTNGEVNLRRLINDQDDDRNARLVLKRAMEIENGKTITLSDMEVIYQFRSPLTKRLDNFEDILTDIARRYQATGVKYAELSLANIVEPQFLEKALEVLPKIQEKTGVELRFLVGLWRHSPPEYNDQVLQRALYLAEHTGIIAGVDFMGHETNSTHAFVDQIKTAARYRGEKDPKFQIRVHAGESPLHPENVRVAIQAGATRIGHGLYGVDQVVLALAKERGVIFEYQLPSNLALNNINADSAEVIRNEVPLKIAIASGVKCVGASDGSGVYLSDSRAIIYAAQCAGLTQKDFDYISRCEKEYLESQSGHKVLSVSNLETVLDQAPSVNFDWERFNQEKQDRTDTVATVALKHMLSKRLKLVDAQLNQIVSEKLDLLLREKMTHNQKKINELKIKIQGRRTALQGEISNASDEDMRGRDAEIVTLERELSQLQSLTHRETRKAIQELCKERLGEEVLLTIDALKQKFSGCRPIRISGASKNSWDAEASGVTQQQKDDTRGCLERVLKRLDLSQHPIVTGGTHFGVEKLAHELAAQEEGATIIGTLTEEAYRDRDAIFPGLTHATLVGDSWFAMSAPALDLIKEMNGIVIFIGGGRVIEDEIIAAKNAGVPFLVMDGPTGASTNKARLFDGTLMQDVVFQTAEGLVEKLQRKGFHFKPSA